MELPISTTPDYLTAPLTVIIQKQDTVKEPKQYILKQNETLTYVSELYTLDLSRLWAKNVQLTNPDLIPVGTVVLIPEADEKLETRDMISLELSNSTGATGTAVTGGSVYGNTYYWGQCVWFVKNQLGWVRNGWGDASSWASSARRDGFNVSETPSIGAVAYTKAYSHVSIVRSIGSGTVHVQEMNFRGLGVVSERDAPISEFLYITP